MGLLTAGLLLASMVAGTGVDTGRASQYSPGRMESTIRNRQHGCCGKYNLPYGLPPVDGYVASKYPREIGHTVWIRPLGSEEWELFLITDCAAGHDGTLDWMLRNDIPFEIDGETAKRWNTVGRLIDIEWMWAPRGVHTPHQLQ